LSAKPFKNKQIHDEICRKSRKIEKYQQIGQSLGAPTFVEAVQAMTPEMRQSTVVLGPIFVQSVCAPEPLVSATPCSNAFAARVPPPTSESEAEAEYEHDTDPPMPKQHTAVVVLPRATSAFDQGSSPRPTTDAASRLHEETSTPTLPTPPTPSPTSTTTLLRRPRGCCRRRPRMQLLRQPPAPLPPRSARILHPPRPCPCRE
jgi:hypothetical protein